MRQWPPFIAGHCRILYQVLMLDGVVLARKTGAGALRRPVLVALAWRRARAPPNGSAIDVSPLLRPVLLVFRLVRSLPKTHTSSPAVFVDELNPGGFQGGHDAMEALVVGIESRKVNFILDADIRSFFDTVGPGMAHPLRGASRRRPAHRPPDPEVAQGGVLEDGIVNVSDKVTGQGAVISPLLESTCTTGSINGPRAGDGARPRAI
jgi:hypothetical protein